MKESPAALERLNTLPAEQAEGELLACCGSTAWARGVARRRPFADTRGLLDCADQVWRSLGRADWLEAFSQHPRIGGRAAHASPGARAREWSSNEQAGVVGAPVSTTGALERLNDEYEDRFGYIYIVCATGKSASELLAILEARLHNAPDDEIQMAAEEQRRITHLRIAKLLAADQLT